MKKKIVLSDHLKCCERSTARHFSEAFRDPKILFFLALLCPSCKNHKKDVAPMAGPHLSQPDPLNVNSNAALSHLMSQPPLDKLENHTFRKLVNDTLEGQITIPFQENKGQWPSEVAFSAHTFRQSVWITRDGKMVYSFPGVKKNEEADAKSAELQKMHDAGLPDLRSPPSPVSDEARKNKKNKANLQTRRDDARGGSGWNMMERFVGGTSKHIHFSKRDRASSGPADASYFIGKEEHNWISKVPTGEATSFGEVWDGIEVELHAKGGHLEKFFYISPWADVGSVRMSVSGTIPKQIPLEKTKTAILARESRAYITPSGAMKMFTGTGEIEFSKPIAYQIEKNGERTLVSVEYNLFNADSVANVDDVSYGFNVGPYDKSRELVIDPILQSTFITQGSNITLYAMPLYLTNQFVIVASQTASTLYPSLGVGYATTNSGGADVFIAALSLDLKAIVHSSFLGGSGFDSPSAILTDAQGNIIVTGSTLSADFPMKGAYQNTLASASTGETKPDVFVAKFGPHLETLLASTYLGGMSSENEARLALAKDGDVLVIGVTESSNFPTTGGLIPPFRSELKGRSDIFITKFGSDLNKLNKSFYFGGDDRDDLSSILYSNNGLYVSGDTLSTNLPMSAGGAQANKATGGDGPRDAFIARFSDDLRSLHQSTYLGGTGNEMAGPLALGPGGDIYFAGDTSGLTFPGTNETTKNIASQELSDSFVSRLNFDLKTLRQTRLIGGAQNEHIFSMVATSSNVFVSGDTNSDDLVGLNNGTRHPHIEEPKSFVSKLDLNLTGPIQTTYVDGLTEDSTFPVAGMVMDQNQNIYLFGVTQYSSNVLPRFVNSSPRLAADLWSTVLTGGEYRSFVIKMSSDLFPCSVATEAVDCAAPTGSRYAPRYCDGGEKGVGTCVLKLGNGKPIPSGAPFNGRCTQDIGTRVCVSSACDTNTQTCGFGNGTGPCTFSNQTEVCLSGVCSTNGPNANKCVECTSNENCASRSGASVCDLNQNKCVQCTSKKDVICTQANSICNVKSHVCAPCDANYGASGQNACDSSSPICAKSGPNRGTCLKCQSNFGSGGEASCYLSEAPICNISTGACGSRCTSDQDCPSVKWCDNPESRAGAGVCLSKIPNGDPLPLSSPILGQCNAANGSRVCLSAACDQVENLCGIKNGDPCNTFAASVTCRSSVCYSDSICGIPDDKPLAGNAEADAGPLAPSEACRSGYAEDGICRRRPDAAADASADTSVVRVQESGISSEQDGAIDTLLPKSQSSGCTFASSERAPVERWIPTVFLMLAAIGIRKKRTVFRALS